MHAPCFIAEGLWGGVRGTVPSLALDGFARSARRPWRPESGRTAVQGRNSSLERNARVNSSNSQACTRGYPRVIRYFKNECKFNIYLHK